MPLFELPKADPELIARVEAATALLEEVINDRSLLVQLTTEQREALLIAAGRASKPDIQSKIQYNKERRRTERKKRRAVDEAKLEKSGIRQKRNEEVFQTPFRTAPKELLAYHPDGVPEEDVAAEKALYAKQVEGILAGGKVRLNPADDVLHPGKALQRGVLLQLDRADGGDPPHVVACKVHEHVVLRTLLGVRKEL